MTDDVIPMRSIVDGERDSRLGNYDSVPSWVFLYKTMIKLRCFVIAIAYKKDKKNELVKQVFCD